MKTTAAKKTLKSLNKQIFAKQAEITKARKEGHQYGQPLLNGLMAEMTELCESAQALGPLAEAA